MLLWIAEEQFLVADGSDVCKEWISCNQEETHTAPCRASSPLHTVGCISVQIMPLKNVFFINLGLDSINSKNNYCPYEWDMSVYLWVCIHIHIPLNHSHDTQENEGT